MKDILTKESIENSQELMDINDEGQFIPNSSLVESPEDKKYIKIPHNFIIFIPVIIVIVFLSYIVTKNFSKKKMILSFLKPKSPEDFSKMGGGIILDIIRNNLRSSISLDYGSGAKRVYKYVIDKYIENMENQNEKKEEISFRHVKIFNLEEICGYDSLQEESHAYWLKENFIDLVDIKMRNVFLLKGDGEDLKNYADQYDKLLTSNQIDLQIINIGKDGMIGFINDGESFNKKTHIVDFKRKKIKEMAEEYFDGNIDRTPKKGITQGIKNIMEAKNILILARGKESALGIKYLMKGEINNEIPITALNGYKGNLYVVADEDACSLL